MIYKHNNNTFNINADYEIGGVVYPAKSLLLRREEWAALGITEEAEPMLPAAEQLQQAKDFQVAEVSLACQNAIHAGFESSALGTPHHYPAQDRDQSNLAASVLESILPGVDPTTYVTPFTCQDVASGVWAPRLHTAAQIQAVGKEAKAVKLAKMQKNGLLAYQINAVPLTADAAADIAAVEAIAWSYP